MARKAIIFAGSPPTAGKTTQAQFVAETTRGRIVKGSSIIPSLSAINASNRNLIPDFEFIPAFEQVLDSIVEPTILFDNIPRTEKQTKVIINWAKKGGVDLQVVQLQLTENEVVSRAAERRVCPCCGESFHRDLKPETESGKCDNDGGLLVRKMGEAEDLLRKTTREQRKFADKICDLLSENATIHTIPATGTVIETAKRVFTALSPSIFYKAEMAQGYYDLRATLDKLGARHLMFSGMPVFMYGGRALMKDFDILVPDSEINSIAKGLGKSVGEKHSSVADTKYVDVAPGVEINSDLMVKLSDGSEVEFCFDQLWRDKKDIRFMGLTVPIMGLEDLILFKIALGRQGLDDFGRYKFDITDVEGLVGAQAVNWEQLEKKRREFGISLKYVKEKFTIANLKKYNLPSRFHNI